MRKLLFALVAVAALVPLAAMASASAPASAAVTHHGRSVVLKLPHAPRPLTAHDPADAAAPAVANASYVYTSAVGWGEIWDDTSAQFKTSHSHDTPLTVTSTCDGSYCWVTVPNGDCMEWDESNNEVNQAACKSGIMSELWWVDEVISGGQYAFYNYYEYNSYPKSCPGSYQAALTANDSGADVSLSCPSYSTSELGTNQIFTR